MKKQTTALMISAIMFMGLVTAGIIDSGIFDKEQTEFQTSQWSYSGTYSIYITGNERKWIESIEITDGLIKIISKEEEERTYEECIKIGTKLDEVGEPTCLEFSNITYEVPTFLPVAKNKIYDKAIQPSLSLEKQEFEYQMTDLVEYKLGFNSITIIPDIITDAILINITYESDFTHLNITDNSPYDKLVGYYPMDVNRSSTIEYDYTRWNNDGSLTEAISITGLYGNARDFDGINDYIDTTNGTGITGFQNFVYIAWIKTTTTAQGYVFSQRKANAGEGFTVLRIDATGYPDCFVYGSEGGNGVGWLITDTSNDLRDGEWHHLVCMRNSSTTGALYVDGVLSSGSGTAKYIDNDEVCISAQCGATGSPDTPNSFFNGSIDEAMIFNESLTHQEIMDIYNNQSLRFRPTGTHSIHKNITNGAETITITGDYQSNFGSSINLTLYYYNGTWNDAGEQVYDGDNTFSTVGELTNITLNFTYFAGSKAGSYSFYTPHLLGENGITIASLIPCTYTNNDGEYKCNQECTFSNRIMNVSNGSDFVAVRLLDNCKLTLNNVTIISKKRSIQAGVSNNANYNLTGTSTWRFAG